MYMGVDDRFALGLQALGSREGNRLGSEGSREQDAPQSAQGISSRQANVAHRFPLQVAKLVILERGRVENKRPQSARQSPLLLKVQGDGINSAAQMDRANRERPNAGGEAPGP